MDWQLGIWFNVVKWIVKLFETFDLDFHFLFKVLGD